MDNSFDALVEIRQMELLIRSMGPVIGQPEPDHHYRNIAFAGLAQLIDHGVHYRQRPAAA